MTNDKILNILVLSCVNKNEEKKLMEFINCLRYKWTIDQGVLRVAFSFEREYYGKHEGPQKLGDLKGMLLGAMGPATAVVFFKSGEGLIFRADREELATWYDDRELAHKADSEIEKEEQEENFEVMWS